MRETLKELAEAREGSGDNEGAIKAILGNITLIHKEIAVLEI